MPEYLLVCQVLRQALSRRCPVLLRPLQKQQAPQVPAKENFMINMSAGETKGTGDVALDSEAEGAEEEAPETDEVVAADEESKDIDPKDVN